MKKMTKFMGCVLGAAFLVTGCASIPTLENTNDELIYNGSSAAIVENHLYYGNAFGDTSTMTTDADYVNVAKNAYLARLDLTDVNAQSNLHSPEDVTKITSEVTSFASSFSFVLGDHIYYATPNRLKSVNEEGVGQNYFNWTSIYRSNFDGSGKTKLLTTEGDVTSIEALKFDGKYYIVVLAGDVLTKISLDSGKSEKIADAVTSVALPETYEANSDASSLDWNGDIYFTTTISDEDNADVTGTNVNKISIKSGSTSTLVSKQNGKTISFIDRVEDVLFYTMDGAVYTSDITGDTTNSAWQNNKVKFYESVSISDVTKIGTSSADYGYVFLTSTSKLAYKTHDGNVGVFNFTFEGATLEGWKVLTIDARTAYLSTTTGVYKANLAAPFTGGESGTITIECDTLVSMTAIYDGDAYAYDGEYIYYYAQLEPLTDDPDTEEDESVEIEDLNYYLHRTSVNEVDTNDDFELISQAKNSTRNS